MTDSKDTEKHPVADLPILQYKNEIINNIRNFPIVLITGETGCGKTTKVPQFIMEDAKMRHENVNIIVSQPRKIAAITIARRVAKELHCQLGGLVGYQVGLDKKVNKMDVENETKTSLLFCTTGVVLQKLIKEKTVSSYTHIILDEIHERDIDTDLVMAILREFLSVDNGTRLILMSATLNAAKFAKYFTMNSLPQEITPPIVEMTVERPYKIEVMYLDDLQTLQISEDAISYAQPTITTEMYQIAAKLIILSLQESDKSILVFLPGFYEIESMHTILRKIDGIQDLCLILVLHAQLSSAEQKEAFMPSTLPKIILSTNISESSVTIPNVESVIDFCLVKNIVVQKESSIASLKLEWASKYNCQQRAGRTGRLCDGKVYRMIHMRYYERHILEETIPEIVRAPLETTILRVKMLDRDDSPTVILNKTMDPPSYSSIVHAILVLKELGGMQVFNNFDKFNLNDGDLTYVGNIMAALPIDVRLSKLIVMGYIFSVFDDILMIAALLSNNSIFQNRFNKKMEDYLMKLKWAQGSACDAITMLNAYKFWLVAKENRKFADWEEEQKWCNIYGLERKSLHEVLKLVQEIKHRLVDLKLEASCTSEWKKHEAPFIFKVCMAAAFYPNYFMLGSSDMQSEKEIYRGLLGLDPNRTIYFRNMKREQFGEIYVEQIKQKIVDCEIGNDTEGLKISFDLSKIFVQFPEKESMVDKEDYEESIDRLIMSEKILPEIYKAVKYRKLTLANDLLHKGHGYSDFSVKSTAFRLKVLPAQFAKEYAIEKGMAIEKNGKLEVIKITYDFPELCVLPQISEKVIHGKVSNIDHCGKFFFQPLEGEPNVLECIQNTLEKEKLSLTIPKSGNLAIVLFAGKYHRARIVNVLQDFKVVCYFFDFGTTEKISIRNVFEVNEKIINEFFFFPERGFHCKLSMVEPSYRKCPRGKWTKESIEVFRDLVKDEPCEIEVYSMINNIASVELKSNGININETLVEAGYAVRCEECFASRLDHNEREAYQITNPSQWINRSTEFKEQENMMIPFTTPTPPSEMLTQSVYLEGPFSPLETTITGVANNSYGVAKIDQKSVNSVAFDSCVENYDGQLIVAADVVKSASNGNTLHSVTTMPNINGLAPILAMIFAPQVMFECDKDFKRIIDLRSNLGFNPINFEAFFPHHVCILPVNVKLDQEDFHDINELRFSMSCLLKIDNNEKIPGLEDDVKAALLLEVKNHILKVLQRDRELLKAPVTNSRKFIAEKGQVYQKKHVREFIYNQVEFPKLIE